MSCSVLHHVEVCVKDTKIVQLLTTGFGFVPFAYRLTPSASKLALRSGDSVFVVVKRLSSVSVPQDRGTVITSEKEESGDFDKKLQEQSGISSRDGGLHMPSSQNTDNISSKVDSKEKFTNDNEHWTVFCCEGNSDHIIDSVFNVALVVKDVDSVTERVRSEGGQVLREPFDLPDAGGQVRYSIVTSCCGNIVHTLIDKRNYSGSFLPGFETIDNHEGKLGFPSSVIEAFNVQPAQMDSYLQPPNGQSSIKDDGGIDLMDEIKTPSLPPLSTHIDHVTYVCEIGKSKDLLSWYEYCFGMKRFMTNREESETEGFVLGDNIGLRLKVMEYWKCAESGLASPDADVSDSSLKLVIAEPLPEVNTSHVDTFLRAHRGPGVQHIGLHTPTMVATVDFMARNGVVFRKAPPVYYEEGIKLDEIKDAGHADEVNLFKELGILLDTEADVFTDNGKDPDRKSYLMQVFTRPLFDEETFFLEVIQRRGARGFGAGNIAALAKSIILHSQQMKNDERHEH